MIAQVATEVAVTAIETDPDRLAKNAARIHVGDGLGNQNLEDHAVTIPADDSAPVARIEDTTKSDAEKTVSPLQYYLRLPW